MNMQKNKETYNVIVVKTCNAPSLLDRFLNSSCLSAENSAWKNTVFMVYDDSTKASFIKENKKVIRNIEHKFKFSIEYRNKKDTLAMIKKFQSMYNVPDSVVRYIFSDSDDIEIPGGFNAAHNASLLHAQKFINENGYSANSVITIHDDDILYSNLEYNTYTNSYEETLYDFIYERMYNYSKNPSFIVSSGKCTGHSGSPISILRQFLQYITLSIELSANIVPASAPSPFATRDEDAKYHSLNNAQVCSNMNNIIDSFLSRSPQIGFRVSSYYANLTADKLIFNQGHMSCRASFVDRFFNPTDIIADYYITSICKQMFKENISKHVFVEHPILHLRVAREESGNAFYGSLYSTLCRDKNADMNAVYLYLFQKNENNLLKKLEDCYESSNFTSKGFISLEDKKRKDIVTIKKYLQGLLFFLENSDDMLYEVKRNKELLNKLGNIVSIINSKVIPALESRNKIDETRICKSEVSKVENLIESLSWWKILCKEV